jgi:hypothetical protein
MITQPRSGTAGLVDRLQGPGAHPAEQMGAYLSAALGGVIGASRPRSRRERILGAALGFDAAGGLWVNESRAGKRWFRRPGAHRWEPVVFAAGHIHPLVVELASGRRAWWRAATAWALPVVACAAVVAGPEKDPRPRAVILGSVAGAIGLVLAPPGWRWLPPLLAFKLVVGHATPDGPLARWVDRLPQADGDGPDTATSDGPAPGAG